MATAIKLTEKNYSQARIMALQEEKERKERLMRCNKMKTQDKEITAKEVVVFVKEKHSLLTDEDLRKVFGYAYKIVAKKV